VRTNCTVVDHTELFRQLLRQPHQLRQQLADQFLRNFIR
jgi:hypothetical protein